MFRSKEVVEIKTVPRIFGTYSLVGRVFDSNFIN